MNQLDIDELTKRLLPLTYFRRNAGEIIEKLQTIGTIILTKDGKPVAQLTSINKKVDENKKIKSTQLPKFVGRYRLGKITTKEIKKIILSQYDKVLS